MQPFLQMSQSIYHDTLLLLVHRFRRGNSRSLVESRKQVIPVYAARERTCLRREEHKKRPSTDVRSIPCKRIAQSMYVPFNLFTEFCGLH